MKKNTSDAGVNAIVGAVVIALVVFVVGVVLLIPAWILHNVLVALGHPLPFWICVGIWYLIAAAFGYANGTGGAK